MPPVVEERKPISKVLAQNPELRGLDTAKFVFTDISYGVRDRVSVNYRFITAYLFLRVNLDKIMKAH